MYYRIWGVSISNDNRENNLRLPNNALEGKAFFSGIVELMNMIQYQKRSWSWNNVNVVGKNKKSLWLFKVYFECFCS